MHQLEYLMEVGLLLDGEKRYREAEKTYTIAMDMAIRAVQASLKQVTHYIVIILPHITAKTGDQ